MDCFTKYKNKMDAIRTGYSLFNSMDGMNPLPINNELSFMTSTPLSELRDSWYYIKPNNAKSYDYYYYKKITELKYLLNELIGVEVSHYMGLPTIEYIIAEENGNISGLLSENFNKDGINYINANDIADVEFYKKIRDYLLTDLFDINNKDIKKIITTYFFGNYFISIKDRTANSKCYINNNELMIAPIFDYESAFFDPEMHVYVDPLFLNPIYLNENLLKEIKTLNNTYKEVEEKINNFNLLKLISIIEEKNNINIPKEIKEYYDYYNKLRKNHCKSLGMKLK